MFFFCIFVVVVVIICIDYFIKEKKIETQVSKRNHPPKEYVRRKWREKWHTLLASIQTFVARSFSPSAWLCVFVYILSCKSFKFIPANILPLLHSYLCVYFWLMGALLLLLCWQWVYLFLFYCLSSIQFVGLITFSPSSSVSDRVSE